jgi:hypothetical protein
MTLHTRVMVTSPGVDPAAVFVRMRQIIDAGEQYDAWTSPDPESDNEYRRTMKPGFHMDLGQGLPALMWVEFAEPGETLGGESHDEWCEEDCSGEYHDPAGFIEINYDTAYGYTAPNGASCSDLHAWITQEIGAWLDMQGATWRWYDESGDGWAHGDGWGTLGDPEVGALGSAIQRITRDPKRDFGAMALGVVAASLGAEVRP